MPKIIIDAQKELLETIKTTVCRNGTISVGRKYAGKPVTVYVVEREAK